MSPPSPSGRQAPLSPFHRHGHAERLGSWPRAPWTLPAEQGSPPGCGLPRRPPDHTHISASAQHCAHCAPPPPGPGGSHGSCGAGGDGEREERKAEGGGGHVGGRNAVRRVVLYSWPWSCPSPWLQRCRGCVCVCVCMLACMRVHTQVCAGGPGASDQWCPRCPL